MKKIVLTNVRVLDKEGNISEAKDIVISENKFESITPSNTNKIFFVGLFQVETIDCSGFILSPGLVNLHTHSPMNIFKGIAEDASPDRWFNEEIWPYESKIDSGDIEAGSRLAMCEMINNGITAFADHYFSADTICKIACEYGIRVDMAPTIFGMTGAFEQQLQECCKVVDDWKNKSPLVSVRLGPHSPYTCNPEQLAICAKTAKELGVGAHLHVEDGESQYEANVKQYGKSPFQIVADSGLMDVPLIVGHGFWISEEERKLINNNVYFASCMKTYQKLGEGPGHVLENYQELPLCIGTDGAASSNTLSVIEQAKIFALTGKYMSKNAELYDLKNIWKMIMRGHDALNFDCGKIEVGKPADFILWDLNKINTAPVYNPLASIIYSSDSTNIVYSMINGSWVKKDGKILIDCNSVLKNAESHRKSILQKGKGKTNLEF